jgi:Coenzyme PQQ synthesis protein D (PqqD)
MQYRANDPNVISETIGEETIIVNLASGHYFSLQGANVDVWEAAQRGHTAAEIAASLTRKYDVSDRTAEEAVTRLLADLEQEELLVPAEDGSSPAAELTADLAVGERLPFAMPPLSKFTDMQDIILLDPVHEVDQRGWPHAPAAG